MKILNFFFKKQQQTKINLNQIDEFIQKKIKEIQPEIKLLQNEINSKKIKIEEYLNELDLTKIQNQEKIPERIITIYQDNKKQYINKIYEFTETLNPPDTPIEMQQYLETILTNIQELEQNTKKNYYVVKEFSQNETQKINKKISDLEKNAINSIKILEQNKITNLQKIKTLKEQYEKEKKEITQLRDEIDKIENQKIEIYTTRSQYLDKIKKLKQSEQYKEYQDLEIQYQESKKHLDYQIEQIKKEVLEIELAIKKLNKIKKTDLDLITKDTYIGAIDPKLKSELKKLEEQLPKLDLKDTKITKIKKAIKKLELINPTNLIENKDNLDMLSRRLRNNSSNLNVKEIQGRIEQLDESIKIENKKITLIHQKIERIRPKLTKQQIRDLIKEVDEYTDLEI